MDQTASSGRKDRSWVQRKDRTAHIEVHRARIPVHRVQNEVHMAHTVHNRVAHKAHNDPRKLDTDWWKSMAKHRMGHREHTARSDMEDKQHLACN